MAVFPRPASPRALIADVRAFLAGGGRTKVSIAIISVLMPVIIVIGFYHDANIKPAPKGPYFVQSWPATRSDEEIKAQQKIDQARRDAEREKRRQEYQRLADQLGIDTK